MSGSLKAFVMAVLVFAMLGAGAAHAGMAYTKNKPERKEEERALKLSAAGQVAQAETVRRMQIRNDVDMGDETSPNADNQSDYIEELRQLAKNMVKVPEEAASGTSELSSDVSSVLQQMHEAAKMNSLDGVHQAMDKLYDLRDPQKIADAEKAMGMHYKVLLYGQYPAVEECMKIIGENADKMLELAQQPRDLISSLKVEQVSDNVSSAETVCTMPKDLGAMIYAWSVMRELYHQAATNGLQNFGKPEPVE